MRKVAVTIEFSGLENRAAEQQIRTSVQQAFKSLPDNWTAIILSRYGDAEWKMIVKGPQRFEIDVTLGAGEHSPEAVVTAIKHVIVGQLSG
ncbi:MAG TPA: hypothetical protein VGK99_23085 [Acidobacteriota bacterium]